MKEGVLVVVNVHTDVIEVEGQVSGHGAVQSRFEERSPIAPPQLIAAPVVLAHSRYRGRHLLKIETSHNDVTVDGCELLTSCMYSSVSPFRS